MLANGVIVGKAVGFTVTVKVVEVPIHPLAVGVTVTVARIGVDPVLIAVYAAILPDPLVPKPTLASDVQE